MTDQNNQFDISKTDPACQLLRDNSHRSGVVDAENLPFMLSPPGAKTAVLLVHGFTATPWEMRLLAEALANSGIASLAIRLPGHGTTPEDLAGRCWEEWRDAVLEGYQLLSEDFPSVYGMGMSTGCLLLLATAKDTPFRGLVLFSPYLRILHRLAPYAGWLQWIRPYHTRVADEETDNRYYLRRPVNGIHQINKLLRAVRKQLTHITVPVLAFNGEGDQTVDIDSGRQLMTLLGSPTKNYKRYGPEVPHVLTREENPCREEMFAQAVRFIEELELPESATKER